MTYTRPPGSRTRWISRTAPAGSGRCSRTSLQRTLSVAPERTGRSSADPTMSGDSAGLISREKYEVWERYSRYGPSPPPMSRILPRRAGAAIARNARCSSALAG